MRAAPRTFQRPRAAGKDEESGGQLTRGALLVPSFGVALPLEGPPALFSIRPLPTPTLPSLSSPLLFLTLLTGSAKDDDKDLSSSLGDLLKRGAEGIGSAAGQIADLAREGAQNLAGAPQFTEEEEKIRKEARERGEAEGVPETEATAAAAGGSATPTPASLSSSSSTPSSSSTTKSGRYDYASSGYNALSGDVGQGGGRGPEGDAYVQEVTGWAEASRMAPKFGVPWGEVRENLSLVSFFFFLFHSELSCASCRWALGE
jgi:hypothetical protein